MKINFQNSDQKKILSEDRPSLTQNTNSHIIFSKYTLKDLIEQFYVVAMGVAKEI